jgi:DNA-binding transcriptional regulator YiaG
MKPGSKYYSLYQLLRAQAPRPVTLSLAEIEALLGTGLPAAAWQRRAWWSNRRKGAVQAAAWMGAGYHVTDVNFKASQVTFARPTLTYRVEKTDGTVLWNKGMVKALRHHLKLTQGELAETLGVRQQTVSEWETGAYAPSRATSKYLALVAEQSDFPYESSPSTQYSESE